ncbi:MAG: N-acetylglucosamine-6-phosphate deacetylase [Ruminococcaceae bacterium]|nr:N-acetylglucosamine-6-phosphate deacetylase [Oscillospiraceae bacterium]
MNNCLIHNAQVYNSTLRGFYYGSVLVMKGRIAILHRGDVTSAPAGVEVYDAEGKMLIPGLVDIHTHGRAGGDFNTADASLMEQMAVSYLDSGVTAVMPTLASATMDSLENSIDLINDLRAASVESEGRLAYIAGVHLEGRYLNVKRRGAHAAELLVTPDAAELASLMGRVAGARHISAALEQEGGEEFLTRALAMGATVSLGHTDAGFEVANRLIAKGVTGLTHTFNAMPPLHHRDGGAVAAGLLSDRVYCELICDGFHIAPHMVKLAYRLAGRRLTLITDSMEATGCPDGEYSIAGNPVTVKDGKARTHDGAIAGSTLSMWEAVQNLRSFADATLGDAIYAATMAPALEAGLADEVGSIEVNKRADLLLLDAEGLSIDRIMCGGYWHR